MADPVITQIIEDASAALEKRAALIDKQSKYYNGTYPQILLSDRTVPLYQQIVGQARSPWAELVIDQAAERMHVTGFRVVTSDQADTDVEADALAWDIWGASQADTFSGVAFQTMLLHGSASILVEDAGEDLPVLSFEHPSTTIVISAPGGRRTLVAVKKWSEGNLDVVVVWTSDGAVTLTRDRSRSGAKWEQGEARSTNSTGLVPVFALDNRPTLLGGFSGDLDSLYPTLDRAAQSLADRLTTQLYASTKVRYLIGVEPELDENGNPTDSTLKLATDRLLLIENPEARAGVFDASDLRQFVEVARSDIAALAAIARLPSYLLSGDLVNVSREALESLMQGLVSRVEQRQTWATPALSASMRLALRLAGDTRVDDPRTRVEPIWAPVVPPSTSDTADAAATLVGAGVLSATGAQDLVLGLTPTERDKARQYARSDALANQGAAEIASLFGTPTPAPVTNAV